MIKHRKSQLRPDLYFRKRQTLVPQDASKDGKLKIEIPETVIARSDSDAAIYNLSFSGLLRTSQ